MKVGGCCGVAEVCDELLLRTDSCHLIDCAQGDRTVLLGDSIHTVKPYFGLG